MLLEAGTIMNVAQLPFNRFLGLEAAEGTKAGDFLVSLPAGPQYANHFGTVHASALLAVAEAGSGAFLVRQFGSANGCVAVVRRIEAKFRRPGVGRVSARCRPPEAEIARWREELAIRGRVLASLPVEVLEESGAVVLTAAVEWFLARDSA